MSAAIIDGKRIAAKIRVEIKKRAEALRVKGIEPFLATTIVGEDPASKVYVNMKAKACEQNSIGSKTHRLPAEISQQALLDHIQHLNKDPKVHGILVQSPLPKHLKEQEVVLAIDPQKDVDGFHPMNVGKMVIGQEGFLPCTPWGVQEMIVQSGIDPAGKHVVVVGRSNIVGKPVVNIFLQKAKGANATVTVCHTGTKDMASHTKQADILIVAAGRPEVITGDMIKPGTVVIDVGVNRVDDASAPRGYKLVGDVHFDSAKEVASAISPVPGGVGPMTITMLMMNTVRAAEKAVGI